MRKLVVKIPRSLVIFGTCSFLFTVFVFCMAALNLADRHYKEVTARAVQLPHPPVYDRDKLLEETNKHRQTPLTVDPALNDSATRKCKDMAVNNYLAHGSWESFLPKDRHRIGENLAVDQHSEVQVVDEWMASPGHKRNLQDQTFHRVGFSTCYFRGSTLVVQHFSD